MAESKTKRRLAAILAADVAGYTRRMEEDSDGTVAAWQTARDNVIDPKVAAYAGRLVKLTGDGFLAEFPTVQDAVKCAVAMQEGLSESPLEFRMGVNLGDIIDDGRDIHGEGVNVAARIEALAEPGGICISGSVHEQVRNRFPAKYENLGEKTVKNVSAPVRVYALRIEDSKSSANVRNSEQPASAPTREKPSVAVLPFTNMSDDAAQEYFSDGMSEDIITELSKISGLLVIGRNSAFTYKGKSVTTKQVGQELDVGYVLEGSVRKAGNRLRITAQLIDAETDHHLWADRYDRDIEDIFAIQDEVARAVADAMKVTLLPDEHERVGRVPTENLEAYDLFMRTRSTPWPPTRENILRARGRYQRVIDMDPGFAGGYAGAALTYAMASYFGHSENAEADAEKAAGLSARAIGIDETFALAYAAVGLAKAAIREDDAAVAQARKAVELQPSDADAHAFLGCVLTSSETCDEARQHLETAIRLDPQYVAGPYFNMLGVANIVDGRYADAVEALEKNVARGGPVGVPQLRLMTVAYSLAGRMEDARRHAGQLLEMEPRFTIRNDSGFYWRHAELTERIQDALRAAGLPE